MSAFNRYELMSDLVQVFNRHNVSVSVGVIDEGVIVRSHDNRVDAVNLRLLQSLERQLQGVK